MAGAAPDDDVRAVVLTGAGEKAFCTGIDRAEYHRASTWHRREGGQAIGRVRQPFMFNDPGDDVNPKGNDLWKPVIAAVNGMACGGALYMLGEADFIIAAEHATFFDPHVTYGMVAGFESMHLLQKMPARRDHAHRPYGRAERMSASGRTRSGWSPRSPRRTSFSAGDCGSRARSPPPPLAIQGTLRAVWMAPRGIPPHHPMAQMSTLVSLGTEYDNIESGQRAFQNPKNREWRLR